LIQQVVIGLAKEWRTEPIAVLRAQVPFFTNLHFNTQWARHRFPQELIEAKIKAARDLLRLLETERATSA